VIDDGSSLGFVQSGKFVPKVSFELVDEINNFFKVRLISVLLGHFNKRFEDSGLFLQRFDLRKLVLSID
jgi:hypothetical protein